jgi:hypothetical protein
MSIIDLHAAEEQILSTNPFIAILPYFTISIKNSHGSHVRKKGWKTKGVLEINGGGEMETLRG